MSFWRLTPRLRVEVDPNSIDPTNPRLTPALFSEAIAVPRVGELVTAVQVYDDEPNLVGDARVIEVDRAFEVMYLQVEWSSFKEEGVELSPDSASLTNVIALRKPRRTIEIPGMPVGLRIA